MSNGAADKKSLDDGIAVYKRLLGYGVPYWKMFAISIVSMIVYASLGPAFAKFLQPLIDGSFIRDDPNSLRQAPLVLVGLSVIRGISGFGSDYCSGWVSQRVIADLRQDLFKKFLDLPCRFYDSASVGQMLSKLLYNTDQVANSLSKGVVALFKDTVMIIGLIALMVYENQLLSMVFMVIGPLLGISVRIVSRKFRKISGRIQESMGHVGHVAQEAIDAQRIVKVFNGQAYEAEKFSRENERNLQRQMKMVSTDAVSSSIIQLIYIGGFAVILFVVSQDSVRNTITPGSLIAFVAAMAMLLSPIKRVAQVINILQKGIAAGDSIFQTLDEPPEIDGGSVELMAVRGHIEFRKVSLSYREDGDPALDQIDLDVPPGKTIALVGHSGSGKTSLIRLLPRIYTPTSGEIWVDGREISTLTLESLRRHIAYVGQEVTLFNDSVASNIAYGCAHADPERIRQAAIAAHALGFIEQLPQGFATPVGPQGVALSGGQRQRIAIARALFRDAPILILDEATSALDAESERAVQDALDDLMKNRTTLVIAHRLSTVQAADRIVVMRNGRIVEAGTHDELLELDGHYAELYRVQFRLTSNPPALTGLVG